MPLPLDAQQQILTRPFPDLAVGPSEVPGPGQERRHFRTWRVGVGTDQRPDLADLLRCQRPPSKTDGGAPPVRGFSALRMHGDMVPERQRWRQRKIKSPRLTRLRKHDGALSAAATGLRCEAGRVYDGLIGYA